jgi:membrane-associated phospholipid phosphatase
MAEGLLVFLGRDLRRDLAASEVRGIPYSSGGGLWLGRWALVCALVGATLFVFCGYHAGFARLNGLAAQMPGWMWESLTVLGDERVAFAVTLFFARRYPQVFWALLIAALFATLFTHSLKPLVGALRPPAVLAADAFNLLGPVLRKTSFPSGHSVTVAVVCAVWVYFLRAGWARAALILTAVAVGLSRTAVGVHWPVDVAAGLTGGILAAWAGVTVAGRSSRGAFDARIHLFFVLVAAGYAVSLLISDRGYHAAAEMQRVIGVGALTYGIWAYVLMPGLRWRREGRARH